MRFSRSTVIGLSTGLALVITVCGWKINWFLTDDAFITFRYASNWVSGIGPTWNPPPFAHIEGYSNFSWLVILSSIWCVFGIEPPQIANWLLLMFGLGSVLLCARWLAKLTVSSAGGMASGLIFLLALLLITTNKSFLTWLSSGLETSLFTLLVLGWSYALCGNGGSLSAIRWRSAVFFAALAALTRPDGLLFWAVTVGALFLSSLISSRICLSAQKKWHVLLALLIVPLHLLWRHYYYHDWLPNTYYAKVHSPWYSMGLRYLLSYFIEYALYVPLILMTVCVYLLRKSRPTSDLLGVGIVLGCVVLQVAYYTLVVGGDHFEYRIFHHLIPLIVIAAVGMLSITKKISRIAVGVLLFWLVAQGAIPWAHWYFTRNLDTRWQTLGMTVPIAKEFPAPIRPVVALWDRLQATMIAHAVGMRHQEHKIFYLFQRATFPPRAVGAGSPWSDRNVLALGSVGVPGWVYPNTAIIDVAGLNDRVLAKQSFMLHPVERKMAHDICASRQYLDCYRPNMRSTKEQIDYYLSVLGHRHLALDMPEGDQKMWLQPSLRVEPLTDQIIVACETRKWSPDELYAKGFYWY